VCNSGVSNVDQQPPAEQAPAAAPQTDTVVIAWQPITPGGVAKFAKASFANVLLVQLLVASLLTAAVFWFVYTAWFPGVRDAIRHLPEKGSVCNGVLNWPGNSLTIVLETEFLGIAVEPDGAGAVTLASDVRVHFQRDRAKVCSLFRCVHIPYSTRYIVELNRPEAEPWWGAWQPILLGFVAVGVPLVLLLWWGVLATVYCPVAWLIAFFADRELTWGGGWRLSAAALMPGAILLSAGVVAYGLTAIDLVRFLTLLALHMVAGCVYVAVAPFSLPRITRSLRRKKNPFAGKPDPNESK
jgi:hypothetical protein